MVLLLTAAGLTVSLGNTAALLEWFQVQMELMGIQVGYIGQPLSVQKEVFLLLWLEKARRLEQLKVARYRRQGRLDPVTGHLPHVDNLSVLPSFFSKKPAAMKMGAADPVVKDLVLIGGGHAHAYVLKNFGMNPMPGVQVTLITRDVDTPYSGMLPGHIAGHYTREECHIDLVRLGNFAKARIIHGEACGIDPIAKQISIRGRPSISYDVLSINIGSSPQMSGPSSAGAGKDAGKGDDWRRHVTAVKPIDKFSAKWDQILERAFALATAEGPNGRKGARVRVCVVGGGAGGVELALAMQVRLRNEYEKRGASGDLVGVSLVARSKTLMPAHNEKVRAIFERIARSRNIQLVLGKEAQRVVDGRVECSDGTVVECDECVWCTNAGAQAWLADTGLSLDGSGFVRVRQTLESINCDDVFAVGDICAIENHPRPKAGVFAVRGGPPLARNLRARMLGKRLEKWEPQREFLGIIGTGDPRECVASRGRLGLEGAWLWELKDWIDRTWMAGYTSRLPRMEEAAEAPSAIASASGPEALAVLAHASMRCGGCGAKVGATVLSNVMKRLKAEIPMADAGKNRVLVGLDSPDDCAVVAPDPQGRAAVHTVDFFRSFIKDPFTFGKIAANHALSDCHAMCAEATTALAIAVVPFGMEAKVEETLFQMMAGACEVLAASGCSLVGGHTCEGSELALGFVINGLVGWPSGGLAKGGMQSGQSIVLTKPIGTGTIFAADMRGLAQGGWVVAALDSMCQSNKDAALILRDHGATSCTDVTGFGLLGHLVEMAQASKARVELNLDAVPTLAGEGVCLPSLGVASRRRKSFPSDAESSTTRNNLRELVRSREALARSRKRQRGSRENFRANPSSLSSCGSRQLSRGFTTP